MVVLEPSAPTLLVLTSPLISDQTSKSQEWVLFANYLLSVLRAGLPGQIKPQGRGRGPGNTQGAGVEPLHPVGTQCGGHAPSHSHTQRWGHLWHTYHPLTCTRSPTPSKGPPACTSSAHEPIITPDHSRSVSPTHIASHTHGHMHPTWTHPPPTSACRACSHLPRPPPHTHPPPWQSHTPLARTCVHTRVLHAHASPAPMLRASSTFPKAESGARMDWPCGVSEGRWVITWRRLVWSEFLAVESGDLGLSQRSKFTNHAGAWMSPFPSPDLRFLICEMGTIPISVGVSRIQSSAVMEVKM